MVGAGVYELDHLPSETEVLAIAEKWRPYRSVASSYLFSAPFDESESPSGAARGAGRRHDSDAG